MSSKEKYLTVQIGEREPILSPIKTLEELKATDFSTVVPYEVYRTKDQIYFVGRFNQEFKITSGESQSANIRPEGFVQIGFGEKDFPIKIEHLTEGRIVTLRLTENPPKQDASIGAKPTDPTPSLEAQVALEIPKENP